MILIGYFLIPEDTMKKYYLKNGTRESGPYMIDDLKYQRLAADTMVKEEGGNWQLVSQNRDLRFLLTMSEGANSYTDSNGKKQDQQFNPGSATDDVSVQAKKRMALLIAVAVAMAIAGMAVSLFFASSR